jgi:hypothetical protein
MEEDTRTDIAIVIHNGMVVIVRELQEFILKADDC